MPALLKLLKLCDHPSPNRIRWMYWTSSPKYHISRLTPPLFHTKTRKFILASDFTADKKELKKSVEKMKEISGGTAFYDGMCMWTTLDLLRRVKDSRKAIVVLTDGVDGSLLDSDYERSDHNFELARVSEEDATMQPIYLDREEAELTRELSGSF